MMWIPRHFATLGLLLSFGTALLAQSPQSAVQKVESSIFRVLSSHRVQGYQVRIKQPQTCESTVQYSGYIDNLETGDHTFFYFVESRSAPHSDPTVLWLNGGPGCSSTLGLWMEIGPCLVNEEGTDTNFNSHSWNSVANMIFLDQPVNVGYSYGNSKVWNSNEAARDVYAFLQLFLKEFSEYAKGDFHISGESYAGHYIPALAAEILKQNDKAEEAGLVKIHLESVLIGNGWTDPKIQYGSYHVFGCAHDNAYKPIYDEETCSRMEKTYKICASLLDTCDKFRNAIACIPAGLYCEEYQKRPYEKTGLGHYDIRKKCGSDPMNCYDNFGAITKYANRVDVKSELGVDPSMENYTCCSKKVNEQFLISGDGAMSFADYVAYTLEHGLRVLLYTGDMDWICNWVGVKTWSLEMNWHGKEGYSAAKDEPWHSQNTGLEAGEVRSFSNLTFLKVFNAGHMVPYDQPEHALDLLGRWLGKLPFSAFHA